MDFAIGSVRGKVLVKPVMRLREEDSDEEAQDRGRKLVKKKEEESTSVLIRVDDLVYCSQCHSAFSDRSHFSLHLSTYHPSSAI